MLAASLGPLIASLPLVLAAMSTRNAIIASVVVVIAVVLIWKLFKGALKLAIVVGIAILIYVALNYFGVL